MSVLNSEKENFIYFFSLQLNPSLEEEEEEEYEVEDNKTKEVQEKPKN